MRHLIPISGKDSLSTAVVQMTRNPDLDYELFFNDIGTELPETYDWLNRVEKKLGKKIVKIGRSLEQVIYEQGLLPSPNTRFCTRLTKIKPMEDYIGDDEVTVYFGIRADEDRAGYHSTKTNIYSVYPLKELGIKLEQVYQIVDRLKLSPPTFFWKRLHDVVTEKLEKRHKTWTRFRPVPSSKQVYDSLPRWVFDSLFAWRSRPNCYFCFFQAKHEWVGLLEHHPNLFDRAERIETEVGDNEQGSPFTWIQNYPLALIRRFKETILMRRAASVLKLIDKRRMVKDPEDLLSITSCGLMCGK